MGNMSPSEEMKNKKKVPQTLRSQFNLCLPAESRPNKKNRSLPIKRQMINSLDILREQIDVENSCNKNSVNIVSFSPLLCVHTLVHFAAVYWVYAHDFKVEDVVCSDVILHTSGVICGYLSSCCLSKVSNQSGHSPPTSDTNKVFSSPLDILSAVT